MGKRIYILGARPLLNNLNVWATLDPEDMDRLQQNEDLWDYLQGTEHGVPITITAYRSGFATVMPVIAAPKSRVRPLTNKHGHDIIFDIGKGPDDFMSPSIAAKSKDAHGVLIGPYSATIGPNELARLVKNFG